MLSDTDEPTRVAAGIIRKDDEVLLCQRGFNHRYALKWEFPGGKTTLGETMAECLERELEEELGITAREWIDLGVCDPFTSVVVSPTRLFLARQLTFGATQPEGTEQIRCVKLPLTEAVQMVVESRLTHAPSGLLILKARMAVSD